MGVLLSEIAQNISDAYYMENPSADDFLQYYHFRFMAAASYAAIMQEGFDASRRRNLSEGNAPEPELSPEWFQNVLLPVTKSDTAGAALETAASYFVFGFDRQSRGVKEIYPTGGNCRHFERVNIEAFSMVEDLPITGVVYWSAAGGKILFKNVRCGLKEVSALIIPAVPSDEEEDVEIPATMVADIKVRVFSYFYQAKNGLIVDMKADWNPNKDRSTEILEYLKQLQNK